MLLSVRMPRSPSRRSRAACAAVTASVSWSLAVSSPPLLGPSAVRASREVCSEMADNVRSFGRVDSGERGAGASDSSDEPAGALCGIVSSQNDSATVDTP